MSGSGLTGSSFLAYAVTITTFNCGDVISSAGVNQNFANLQTAVERLSVKFEAHFASDITLTVVTNPVDYPVDYVNPAFILEDASTANNYVIPETGVYQIFYDFSASSMMTVKLAVNGSDQGGLGTLRKFVAGDVVSIWFG